MSMKTALGFSGVDYFQDGWRNGTVLNITGLVGSGDITFVPKANNIIEVTIFNITSLTSGALGKEAFSITWYPKSNVDDTYSVTMPIP